MSLRPSILLYGHDLALLETRQWILEKHALSVRKAYDFPSMSGTLCSDKVDLLILCHSLSALECKRALAVAHVRSPQTKTLVLTANDSTCGAGQGDVVFRTEDGPPSLVATVKQLLQYDSPPAQPKPFRVSSLGKQREP
jgi:hypothetical protein